MIKTVAVIGGTGMLGKPVSEAFARAGYRVVVVSRNASKAAAVFNPQLDITVREADMFHPAQLEQALHDADAIHINLSGNSPATYEKNHIQGTEAVLRAKPTHTQLITMISTATAYPQNDFRVDTKAKLAAEQLLKESGTHYMTYLPSWFYETLELLVDTNTVTTMCDATQPLHWVSAESFANAVVDSYQQPSLFNRRLTLFGPEKMTINEAADKYAEHMGYQRFHMSNEEAISYAKDTQDDTLLDAVDLLLYTEKVGEHADPKTLDHPLVLGSHFENWLDTRVTGS
ncbi:SDR family oxidoreductase [Thaumasiovibrio subtropicus]|uniref:SDR family oxidoreductase n=1 Tax=Thaumasiovibrio subtropicus TaxID=1891207 RepID=UPI000B356142|nr:SDR family oxidoreductase [Thaumasiovibrio subtropicus]